MINNSKNRPDPVDFTIISSPEEIAFTCPHCECDVTINVRELEIPHYWGDPWPDVECGVCDEMIPLGDWTYD